MAEIAARQFGVAATWQLRSRGVDRHLIARRCRDGVWVRLAPRVVGLAGAPASPERQVMVAVLDAGPEAVASHEAAAWLWRLPGFPAAQVVIDRRDRAHAATVGPRHRPVLVLPHHRTELRGIPVTSLPRTVFDLAGTGLHTARMERLVNTVVTRSPAMLPALHRTLGELAQRGRPGITLMREVLAQWPEGSRVPASGLEARVLQIARNGGIHELEPQVDVGGHSWLGRVDFAILRLGLLVEVDSELHHTSPLDAAHDAARDAAMLAAGWRHVLRINEEDVWRRPHIVLEQLWDVIRRLEAISA